jgi:hypothetical protein
VRKKAALVKRVQTRAITLCPRKALQRCAKIRPERGWAAFEPSSRTSQPLEQFSGIYDLRVSVSHRKMLFVACNNVICVGCGCALINSIVCLVSGNPERFGWSGYHATLNQVEQPPNLDSVKPQFLG